jgi:hypothetical protein
MKTVFRSRYPRYQWRGCTFNDGRFETENAQLVADMVADPYCGEGKEFWVESLPAQLTPRDLEQTKPDADAEAKADADAKAKADAEAEAAEKAKTGGKTRR